MPAVPPKRTIQLKPLQAHQNPVWPQVLRQPRRPEGPAPQPVEETLWGLPPRAIISVVRTGLFVALLIYCMFRPARLTGPFDAAVYGAVFADYLTWFAWTFLFLPRHLLHGAYEAVLNVILGFVLARTWQPATTSDADVELLIWMFIAFLAVLGVKAVVLSITLAEDVSEG